MREKDLEMRDRGAERQQWDVETASLNFSNDSEAGGHREFPESGHKRRGVVLRRRSWPWLLSLSVFALMMIQPRAAGISLAALSSPKLGVEPASCFRKRRAGGAQFGRAMVVACAGNVALVKVRATNRGGSLSENHARQNSSPDGRDFFADPGGGNSGVARF